MDAKTGLKGAKLPISFGNAKGTLGSYTSANGGALRFSRHYFDDASWKRCCLEVGALPIRCYSRERAKYYQDKHEKEKQKSSALDQYMTGCAIVHPKFGTGKIIEIVGKDHTRYAVVTFMNMENKKISLTWVDENCRRCA